MESSAQTDEKNEATIKSNLTVDQKKMLFHKADALQKDGKLLDALHCYIQCIQGLENGTTFELLPQCLRNIADSYYALGEYDKAVKFAKAEKLFYESVLIESTTSVEEHCTGQDSTENMPKLVAEEKGLLHQAIQYELLSRLCLAKSQPNLALEYCGKAAQMRQEILGHNHPVTLDTLNLFTSVYAEVGRQQYAECLNELQQTTSCEPDIDDFENTTPDSGELPKTRLDIREEYDQLQDTTTNDEGDRHEKQNQADSEPTPILRKRPRKSGDSEHRPKQVRFDHLPPPYRHPVKARFWLTLAICVIISLLVVTRWTTFSPYSRSQLFKVVHELRSTLRYCYYRFFAKNPIPWRYQT